LSEPKATVIDGMSENVGVSSRKTASSARRQKRETESRLSAGWQRWAVEHEYLSFAMVSAVWVLALYHAALRAPFVYDDVKQILQNPWLGSLHSAMHFLRSSVSFTDDFLRSGQTSYRPVFWMSLVLDRAVWGLDHPGGFHLTNLLLHWADGLLGFLLLRRLGLTSLVAATSALLWLGLPINSEVVAWVSGRSYSLMFGFMLLGLLSGHAYLQSGRGRMLAGFGVCSLLALLSNEAGVLVIPLGILVAYATGGAAARRPRMLLLGGAAAVYALYFYLRHLVGIRSLNAAPTIWPVSLSFFKYLAWMFLPFHMSVERSTDMPANHFSAWACLGLIGLSGIAVLLFRIRKRLPDAAGGLMWTLIALLPFCGVMVIYQGLAERYAYLASAGVCLVICALMFKVQDQERRTAVFSLVFLWVLWGVWRLESRVADWTDPARLYSASLQATPGSTKLLYNLGAVSEQRGALTTAESAYQKALTFKPDYEPAIAGLGNVYLRRNDPHRAQSVYYQALALKPDDAASITNLAVASQEMNETAVAEQQYKRAIAVAPNRDDAYTNLGALLFQEQRVPEAIAILSKAVSVNGQDATAYYDLAAIYQNIGKRDLALSLYRKVLALKPDDPDALSRIAQLDAESSHSNASP
jgi:protein O-mannosyl-transferase